MSSPADPSGTLPLRTSRPPVSGPPAPRPRTLGLSRRVDEAPPQLYFLVSAAFHYLGPSFAVLLFARLPVLGVAWLRIASAAVIDTSRG